MALTVKQYPSSRLTASGEWRYLEAKPHSWRRSLGLKGRRLHPFTVWRDMQSHGRTLTETADNWGLTLQETEECIRYCRENEALLHSEAEEEARRLRESGVALEPPPVR